ncbi:Transposase C of IS166 homeodomain-containing protein [Sulfitobacter litoralis]|uniref:Transposase C of IS166 homeodomain-containing protein n=1 Tax=Sulfitobacter litoralis TaxID=335975 RepID=A0ABY0SWC3_9RHOB|nr:Transposase C of IS166 homeodomain-containing protein [Sulfitobacter litoralis]
MSKPADLPNDIEALKALLAASEDRNLRKQDRIDQLEKLVADFKRALFGARSEKADPEQFELALEDIETALSVMQASPAGKGWRRSTLKMTRWIHLHRARQNRAIPTVAHSPNIYCVLKK